MANSNSQKIRWEGSNVNVTLNGQPGDESLSVPVNQKCTVTVSDCGVTSSSADSTTSKTDGAGNNYYEHSIDFTWPHNRNTQGSISGTLTAKVSKDASYLGESLSVSLSGLNYVATSDKRSFRSANPKITVTIPKNTSTNDLSGGTYGFYTDMFSKDNKFDAVRGIYQDFYNEVDPTGVLTLSTNVDWITFSDSSNSISKPRNYNYSSGSFDYTPYIVVSPHLPSIKYGTVSGNQTLSKSGDPSLTGSTVSVSSSNNGKAFATTTADKSNAHVDARTGSVSFSFSKSNSSNTATNTGSFNVTQIAGNIDSSDPKITYNWTVTKASESKLSSHSSSGNKITLNYASNDGTNSTMGGTQTCSEIKQGKDYDGFKYYDGKFYLYNSGITYTLASNSSSHTDTVTCEILTEYTSSTDIKNQKTSTDVVQPGSNYTVRPYERIRISVEDPNNNAGKTIPGTTKHPYLKLSTDNSNFSTSVDVDLQAGSTNGSLEDITLYYKFNNNKPSGTQGGGISGSVTLTSPSSTPVSVSNSGATNPINLVVGTIDATPVTTYEVPEYNWKVKATKISSGTQTGTVSLFKEFTATQAKVAAELSSNPSTNLKVSSNQSWCTITPTTSWNIDSNSSNTTKTTNYVVDGNPLEYNKYSISHDSTNKTISGKISEFVSNKDGSARSATISIRSDNLNIGTSSFIVNQNARTKNGNINLEGHGGVTLSSTTISLENPKSVNYTLPTANNGWYANNTLDFTVDPTSLGSDGGTVTLTRTGSISCGSGEDKKNIYVSYTLSSDADYPNAKANGTDSTSGNISLPDVLGATADISNATYEFLYRVDGVNASYISIGTGSSESVSIGSNSGSSSSGSIKYTDDVNKGNGTLMNNPFTFTHVPGNSTESRNVFFRLTCNKTGVNPINKKISQSGSSSANSTTWTFSEASGTTNCSVSAESVTATDSNTEVTGPSKVTINTDTNGNYRIFNSTSNATSKGSVSNTRDLNCGNVSFFDISSTSTKIGVSFSNITNYDNGLYINADYNYTAVLKCDADPSFTASTSSSKSNGLIGPITLEYKVDDGNWTVTTDTTWTTDFKPTSVRYSVDTKQTKTISGRIRIGDTVVTSDSFEYYYTIYKVVYYNA